MLQVTLADLLRFGVVLGVVIAIGKAQAVLRQSYDHGVGVVGILLGAAAEEHRLAFDV